MEKQYWIMFEHEPLAMRCSIKFANLRKAFLGVNWRFVLC